MSDVPDRSTKSTNPCRTHARIPLTFQLTTRVGRDDVPAGHERTAEFLGRVHGKRLLAIHGDVPDHVDHPFSAGRGVRPAPGTRPPLRPRRDQPAVRAEYGLTDTDNSDTQDIVDESDWRDDAWRAAGGH